MKKNLPACVTHVLNHHYLHITCHGPVHRYSIVKIHSVPHNLATLCPVVSKVKAAVHVLKGTGWYTFSTCIHVEERLA